MRIRAFSPGQARSAKSSTKPAPGSHETTRKRRKRRRGVTALEYLVMLSFVLLAVIITVQKLGQFTGSSLNNSADATAKTNQPTP